MMLDISKDIHSLTDFKRHSADFLQQLKGSRRPMVLTVNGKAEVVVQNAESYQKLLELVDRLEAMEGIQRGLEEMAAGQGRPASEFFAELEEEYTRTAEE
jgi:PHD/YefM family antitoxin component YafN of YafNO toxin-antitoxin module